MKKIIYSKVNEHGYDIPYDLVSGQHSMLHFIFTSFYSQYDWITFEQEGDDYLIGSDSLEEEYELMGQEVPKLRISVKNYRAVKKQWNDNTDNGLAPHLVLWQDEKTGWISLDAKQELSAEDLLHIAEENKIKEAKLRERCQKND